MGHHPAIVRLTKNSSKALGYDTFKDHFHKCVIKKWDNQKLP